MVYNQLLIYIVIGTKNKRNEMIKVLIIGFRHSGTTMLMQLLRAHPQVGWIEFEESYIEFDKPKEWVLMMAKKKVADLKKYAWGEKIPWALRDNDIEGKRAIQFSKKWLKFFKKDGRVLHILRHPIDVALSGQPGNNVGKKEMKYMKSSIPKVIDFINSNGRCATIVYEDLVTHPEIHLPNIFRFLKLNDNKKIVNKIINTPLKFGKINADRAFAYKNKEPDMRFDYNDFLDLLERRI
jgi:hypothetical protein